MMGWYRRGKLALRFRGLALRVATQNPNFQRSSRICASGYLDSGLKGASFDGFSSFYSISLGDVVGVNRNFHNPFLLTAKRFYRWFQNTIGVLIVVTTGSMALITVYFGKLETVPYTKRTHFILNWDAMERRLEKFFEYEMTASKEKILPPAHPESVRVRMIAKDIIDVLQRGLRKEHYALEHAMLVEGSWHMEDEILDDKWDKHKKGQERGLSQAATSHLHGLNWETFVVNDPHVNAYYYCGGKIVVTTGFLENFKSDAEIATIIGHEVGHAVARHIEEKTTMGFSFIALELILILYQFVSPGIVNRMHSLFLLPLPFFFLLHVSRREEIEADYIGLLLIASAGYDPRVAPKYHEKSAKIYDDYMSYFSTHPPDRKRAELLAQAKIMEEARTVYRNVKIGI